MNSDLPTFYPGAADDVAVLWGPEQPLTHRGYLRLERDSASWVLLTDDLTVPDERLYLWFPMRGIAGTEHVRVVGRVVERTRGPGRDALHVRIVPEVASHPLGEIVRLVFDGDVGLVDRDSLAEGRDSNPTLDDDDRVSGGRSSYEAADAEAAIKVAEKSLTEPLVVEQVTDTHGVRWPSIALIAAVSLGSVITLLVVFRFLVWPFMR